MKSEDEIKAENNLLKLKLELEHDMQMMDTSGLDPEIENKFLSNIYNFEKLHKEAKQITIYDFLGRPAFKYYNELNKKEISTELDRLVKVMYENQICLDFCCDYEDETIYKFITEELFLEKTDDVRTEGMFLHFIYEEYHPNHDYDLRRYATEFIEKIISGKWNPELDESQLYSTVYFQGKSFDKKTISKFILTWQACFHPVKSGELSIEHVDFDLENKFASVRVKLNYSTQPIQSKALTYAGISFINFKKTDWDYWCISSFQFPGFGD